MSRLLSRKQNIEKWNTNFVKLDVRVEARPYLSSSAKLTKGPRSEMAFDLHPILDKDASPRPALWYAVAPDGAPAARVGATAIQARDEGSVLLCAGAAPEGAFSDLHQLKIDSGKLCN